jgi:hypothetical protein
VPGNVFEANHVNVEGIKVKKTGCRGCPIQQNFKPFISQIRSAPVQFAAQGFQKRTVRQMHQADGAAAAADRDFIPASSSPTWPSALKMVAGSG